MYPPFKCFISLSLAGGLHKGTPFSLTQVALIAVSVTPTAPVLFQILLLLVVVVPVVAFCASHSNLHWCWSWLATCAGGVFPSTYSYGSKYSTCTHGGYDSLQLALVVFFLLTPITDTLLYLCNLHCMVVVACGGSIMWLHVVYSGMWSWQLYIYVRMWWPVVDVGMWMCQVFYLWVKVSVVGLWLMTHCNLLWQRFYATNQCWFSTYTCGGPISTVWCMAVVVYVYGGGGMLGMLW